MDNYNALFSLIELKGNFCIGESHCSFEQNNFFLFDKIHDVGGDICLVEDSEDLLRLNFTPLVELKCETKLVDSCEINYFQQMMCKFISLRVKQVIL